MVKILRGIVKMFTRVNDWFNYPTPCDETSSRQQEKCAACKPIDGHYQCWLCRIQGGNK